MEVLNTNSKEVKSRGKSYFDMPKPYFDCITFSIIKTYEDLISFVNLAVTYIKRFRDFRFFD